MNYRLMKLRTDVLTHRDRYKMRVGQKDLLEQQRTEALQRFEKAQKDLGAYDLVQILLQKTSDFARQQSKTRIEQIVTSALSVVFGADYRFTIELNVKGNQPVAEYFLSSGDGVTTQLKPPDYDRGGGVADVVSLALRLAVGELIGVRGPLFLDEVGKHVSAEFAPNVAFFLKQYSQQFGRQIILITHNDALAEVGDNAISVTKRNGASLVQGV